MGRYSDLLRTDGPKSEILRSRSTGPGAYPAPINWVLGLFPGGEVLGRGVDHSLMLRLKKEYIPVLSLSGPSWPVLV